MKTIIRNIAIYTFILFLLPYLIPGVLISGGIWTLVVGGIVLTLLFFILKPILSIISFPVNLVTLGIFNVFINALLLYLLTILVTQISVVAFTSPRTDLLGVIIPAIHFNIFFAYVYTAFVLSAIDWLIKWLIQ